MKRFLFSVIAFIIILGPADLPAGPSCSARVLELYRNIQKVLIINDSDKRDKNILLLAEDFFNFELFAKLTMEDHWKSMTLEQKGRFLKSFGAVLKKNVLEKINGYKTKDIKYFKIIDERVYAENYFEVKCKTKIDQKDATFSLIMDSVGSESKIVDIILSGADLIANYKGQFNRIVRDHGIDGLLTRLEERKIN